MKNWREININTVPEKSKEKPGVKEKPEAEAPKKKLSLSAGGLNFAPEFRKLALEMFKEEFEKESGKFQKRLEKEKNKALIDRYKELKKEFNISLQNPLIGVKANAELSYSIGEVLGASFAELKKENPGADETLLKRFALAAGVSAYAFGTKLVTHEYGHARAQEQAGGKSTVDFFKGKFGGHSLVDYPEDLPLSVAAMIATTTAGLSQEEETAKHSHIKDIRAEKKGIQRDPLAELPHAVTELVGKFGTSSYILLGGRNVQDGNDIDGYLAQSQVNLSREVILANSLLMSVLSGSTIDNARKVASYLEDPNRKVEKTSFKVGSAEVYLPELSYYLTPEGGFYTAAVLAGVKDKLTRTEFGAGKVGEFLEFQLYDYKLGEKVSVSPYIAVSHRKKGRNEIYRSETNKERFGGKVGTEFEVALTKDIKVIGETGVAYHDLKKQYVVPAGSKTVLEGCGEFFGWLGIEQKF